MRYKTLDGMVFEAANPAELGRMLWQSKFVPEATIEQWMVGSAQRALAYKNAVVRVDTIEGHVDDLLKAGLVTAEG